VSRGNQRFRKTEMARALVAAQEAGLNVRGFKINSAGEIEVETGPPMAPVENAADEWKVA
jgi:hypothetical protein